MKRILTLLALLTVTGIMVSCGDNAVKPTESSGGDTQTSASSTDTGDSDFSDGLGSYDFGGQTFSVYTRTTTLFHANLNVAESSSEILDDAIYKRNRKIEERFNFIFDEQYYDWSSPEGNDAPRKLLTAGDDTYDMIVGRNVNMFAFASEGFFYRIDDLDAIDLSKPWWDDQLYNDLSIGDTHYFAVGAFNISSYDFTHVMLFNKDMLADFQLDDPYALVRDGKWTFDKFAEMGKTVVKDVDGNSVMDDEDQYGYSSLGHQVLPCFWVAADTVSIGRSDDNELVFTAPSDKKFIDVWQKIFEITWDDYIWHRVPESMDSQTDDIQFFSNGHALFSDSSCFDLVRIRDSEIDFGILPFPKYNEEQEKYYSRIEGCELFGIPKTNTNPEMASVILESMACESLNTVIPAYYDISLKVKFTRDNESAEMLDIAFQNRVFDYGDTLLCTELRGGAFRLAFAADNRNAASLLESLKGQITSKLDSYNEAFASLAD